MRKTIFTLNIGNYAPEITKLTYPLLEHYAKKIGADFHIITERKFPDFPITYEKLQIYELAKELKSEWNIYIDSDALVHPDMFDPTNHITKDMVLHNATDMAGNRWRYDNYFLRDGRNIGSCNWFTIASDWCLDLWKPLDDLTLQEAVANIFPTQTELNTVITPDHLIDDYVVSRNIAKYGLKFKTLREILKDLDRGADEYFCHEYIISIPEKVNKMKSTIERWGVQKIVYK
jgi:hypothetical protein